MSNLRYRSDVDGLRAVAVLGVIIYHAFPKVLPGGFIGVDIFFVISGYLISGILYKGVREGGFSLSEFYARRIRRLFPSLITVLILCLIYGYYVLLRHEYKLLGEHVAAGTLFIQNIVFWQESGYFDISAIFKPLLHLWSLGVEEQFYIFFPPLLLLFWRRRWPMATLIGALLFTSLVADIYMSYRGRDADFYLMPFRAWEFLSGSLLAWWYFGKNHEEETTHGNSLSIVGTILLIAGMTFIHQGDHFPGWRAGLPALGSVMLIAAGSQAPINRWILSHPAIVWIGLISYPLYLFHWPALSFVHIIKGEYPSALYVWGALATSFLMTVGTYYLVEKPIRFSKAKYTIWTLSFAFIMVGVFGLIIWRKGIESKSTPSIEKVAVSLRDRGVFEGWINQEKEKNGTWVCWEGGKIHKTLYLGDSNIWQYAPRILELVKNTKNKEIGVIMIGSGGTPPIPDCETNEHQRVTKLINKFNQIIEKDSSVQRVVIAAAWDKYFCRDSKYYLHGKSLAETEGKEAAIQSFGNMLKKLKAKGKEVVVVLSVPNGERFDPNNFFHRTFTGFSLQDVNPVTNDEFLSHEGHGETRERLKQISMENKAVVIDPLVYLSNNGFCTIEDNNGPIRCDDHHLRPGYVQKHINYLDWTTEY